MLNEINDLKKKLNPKDYKESTSKNFEWFDWTDTVATRSEIRTHILINYHDTFAKYRKVIGIILEPEFNQHEANSQARSSCSTTESSQAFPPVRIPFCRFGYPVQNCGNNCFQNNPASSSFLQSECDRHLRLLRDHKSNKDWLR